MKRLITSTMLVALFAALSASAAQYKQPQVPVANPNTVRKPVVKSGDLRIRELIHQDDIEACVNAVAQACDGHFTRAISRDKRSKDVLPAGQLKAALATVTTSCGHFSAGTGQRQLEVFLKKAAGTKLNDVVAFTTNYNELCKTTNFTLPEQIDKMVVSENRAWFLAKKATGAEGGHVYSLAADWGVRKFTRFLAKDISFDARTRKVSVTRSNGQKFEASELEGESVTIQRNENNFSVSSPDGKSGDFLKIAR